MKYILLLMVVLLSSCATTKKNVEQTKVETTTDRVEMLQEQTTERFIDTTKTENGKVTITDIEFYTNEADTTTNNGQNYELYGIGVLNNSIKHIKQTVIEKETTKKGESKEVERQKEEVKQEVSTNKNETNIVKTEKTTKRTDWMGIICMIVNICVLLYVCWNNKRLRDMSK